MRRILLVLAGLLVALVLAEGALRVRYPLPPSLSAMAGALPERAAARAGKDLALCRDWASVPLSLLSRGAAPGQPELWVSGDSVAMGWGVESGASFGSLLADRVRAATGTSLRYANDGTGGGSLCTLLARARHVATARPPTWAVLAVFADDLQDHGAMYVDGRLVAWPESRFDPPLSTLLRTSWLANLAWFASVSRDPAGLDAAIPPEEHALVVAAIADTDRLLHERGVTPLWLLLPPAGRDVCRTGYAPGSRCAMLEAGMVTLRGLYARAGVPLLDLTDLFTGQADMALAREAVQTGPDAVPIHPNERGHARIAAAVWPALEPSVRGR